MVAIGHKEFNELGFSYGKAFDINFTAIPYYVTLDNIKVYGVIDRDLTYKNAVKLGMDDDTADNPSVEDTFVKSKTEVVEEEVLKALPIKLNNTIQSVNAKDVLPDSYPVITKVYANGTEEQAVLKGNNVGKVWSKEYEGKVFAGTFVTTEGDIVTLDEAGIPFDEVFIPMDEE